MVDLSSKTKNQLRELLQRIGLEEGFEKPADWCLLSGKTIRDYEGTHFHNSCLKKYFKDEPGLMVTELMPALGLTRWQFKHKPRGFWDKPERARDYLLWLQRHLNLSSIKELSVVHSTTIRDKYFGKALILKYRGDMFQIFTDLFPEIELDILEFNYPLGFFEALDTRKRFVREIGRRNNLHSAEDFSNLNHKHFNQSIVGRRLLGNVYNLAPSAAITELFPDHEYKEWQFLRVPRDFWKKKENHRRAIDWLIKDVLLITHPEDFYSIRERDFEANGLSALLRHYGGAKRAIIQNYPEHEFEEHLFEKIGKAAKRLFSILSLMYPELEIKWRYKHRQMRYTKSGYPMELDIYIPKLEFGIEYQGGQHKEMPTHWGGDSGGEIQVARDNEKREACTRMGIRLLEIWDDEWDGSPLQLASILSKIGRAHV